jgi:hypothetical protein
VSLDAHVSCDCFERDRLRSSPPPGCTLSVRDNGGLSCGSSDRGVQAAFERWCSTAACEHRDGCLVSHRIGNIAQVAALRAELSQWPELFPIILSQVIHNGVHCGDFIPAAEMPELATEVADLEDVHCAEPDPERLMRHFEAQMRELVEAALRVGKPLAF